jgi:hypothetical protein
LREKSSYMYNSSFFGLPLYYLVPKANLTNASIYHVTFQQLKRFLVKDLAASSNEEINSKLNNSLNVHDEDDQPTRLQQRVSISDSNPGDQADIQQLNSQSGGEDDEESLGSSNSNNSNTNSTSVRSSQRLKNKSIQQSRVFNLILCKNDNIDFDNSHVSLPMDDGPVELNAVVPGSSNIGGTYGNSTSLATASSNQAVSLIADFGANTNKRVYNKKTLEVFYFFKHLKMI